MERAKTAYRQKQHGCYALQLCGGGDKLLKRFDALPYAHKVVFVPEPVEGIMSAVYLKNYDASRKNLYRTISITGKRCIDQFDYVNFINCLEEEKHEKS